MIRPYVFCKIFIMLSLLASQNFARAQNNTLPLVSAEFTNASMRQVLVSVEKMTGYQFFYDTLKLDTAKINLSVKNKPLEEFFDSIFFDKGIMYTIDQQKHVFISRGMVVETELPQSFFEKEKARKIENVVDTVAEEEIIEKTELVPEEGKVQVIGQKIAGTLADRYIVTGYIKDAKTGEPVIGASVYIQNPSIGVVTDQYGFFTIMLPKGRHTLFIQSIGMEDTKRLLFIQGEGKLNVTMQSRVMTLKGVTVSAQKASNIRNTQIGVQKIDVKTIKQVPVVFGESDVLRVALTMPGIKSVGEASTGLNVRGGAADQNLILFNDANIYNPAHFFGMFSAFNPELVKDVEVFKSSIPARYGGRLSSVVNINSREGNKKDFTGSAGIGLLTSRFNLEGPFIKDKSSFMVGGRSTYANWLLKQLPDQYKNSKAGFYDANLIINHEFNKKNILYVTGYLSNDQFNLNSDTVYHYNNKNISLKWKHTFNSQLYLLVTTGHDGYQYNISSKRNPINAYALSFDINQTYFKTHFNYFINARHTLDFGLSGYYHKLHPGKYGPAGNQSLVVPIEIQAEQALETALYFSDKFSITQNLTIDAGVRYSVYNFLGPSVVNNYRPGSAKTEESIIGTTVFSKGQFIKTYQGPEVRLSMRQMLSNTLSVKAGYNSQRQYIHMLSNTAAMAPTDIWKLSDGNIQPQFGDQFSLGLYKNLKSNTIELSMEGYYKRITDYLDYKSGAVLVLNPHIETDVIKTTGKAYGVEFLLKRLTGKLNGWLSYTYSRTFLKAANIETGDYVNGGNYYPANYDKPHDVSLISNYRFSHRFSTSLNTTYSTGRPITLPIGTFHYADGDRTLYGDRNGHRIPDYFRIDFSMNIEGNHKIFQKTHNSWTLGVYNLTGRHNPYSVYYVSENGIINGYKLSIFANAIPFINFNIRF